MTHALIIGGGIAGTTTAMALNKAGISSTVYEAYPSGGNDIGAFLQIMHNGMDALRAIDADQVVVDGSFRTSQVEYLDAAGKPFVSRSIGGEHARDDGVRTLSRASLYHALQNELVRRGGRIEHNKRLSNAASVAGGRVLAYFTDGTQAEGDLLIGADGIHSTIRTVVDAQAPVPRYSSMNIVYGRTADPAIPMGQDVFRMIHGNRGLFGYTTSPEGVTFWVTYLPGSALSKTEIASITPMQWRERLSALFTDDADTTAARIVGATDNFSASGVYDIPSLPTWYRGSMVLVGDAAHAADPQAAQGASMALEDSVILAQCLRDLPTLSEAFYMYERIRRPRVERLVAFSGAHTSSLDQAKDKASPEKRAWLYEHHIEWNSLITADNTTVTL
ncbi:FAD-dependent monooxygenase [Nocardia sp. NPDC088792]|uniref:FAD-dependent monooxygenase n=1 Tax=Nocardia sp. NPDC088792 TaxID=3364332 RepID=UPI003817464C